MSQFVYNVETGEVTELPDAIANPSANNDLAWFNLRMERNALLAACDWTVLADTPTSTAAWKAYRQQLRDLPANTTDPHNVVWPTPPA
jgi:hypothetical protein